MTRLASLDQSADGKRERERERERAREREREREIGGEEEEEAAVNNASCFSSSGLGRCRQMCRSNELFPSWTAFTHELLSGKSTAEEEEEDEEEEEEEEEEEDTRVT